jgi:TonB family protein
VTGEARWRSTTWRWPSAAAWRFWAISIFIALAIEQLFPQLDVAAFVIALPLGFCVNAAVFWLWYALVAPVIARFGPPAVPVRPPPATREGDEAWTRPPRPVYPALARARGQEGWITFDLRVDRRGRVRAYRITDAAPPRIFLAAVADALPGARVAAIADGPKRREVSTRIRFVMPAEAHGEKTAAGDGPWG